MVYSLLCGMHLCVPIRTEWLKMAKDFYQIFRCFKITIDELLGHYQEGKKSTLTDWICALLVTMVTCLNQSWKMNGNSVISFCASVCES